MAATSVSDSDSDNEHTAPIPTTNGADKGPSDDDGGLEQYYMSGPNEQQSVLTRLKKLDLVGAFLFVPSIVMACQRCNGPVDNMRGSPHQSSVSFAVSERL
jgi:hypothetical protein